LLSQRERALSWGRPMRPPKKHLTATVTLILGAMVTALAALSGNGPVHLQPGTEPEIASAAKGDPTRNFSLRYVMGSTSKIEQIVGDTDVQTKQPTFNQTERRYSIKGTDLGYSFEHNGQAVFLFGDTIGNTGGDVVAYSSSTDPDGPLALNFLTDAQGRYERIEPPGISMAGYEVPVSGIDINGVMYVVVKTNHVANGAADASILTRYDDLTHTYRSLREISQLPGGHFITMSMRLAPEGMQGLPTTEPYVLMFGSGEYRRSNAYLAAVPAASFETGAGTVYYAGKSDNNDGPAWSANESDAAPVIEHPTIGDVSVTYVPLLGLWVALYDARTPRGIVLRYSPTPWGNWSAPVPVFDPEIGYGSFIHDPMRKVDDGLAGPMNAPDRDPKRTFGGFYAPYIIDRFTRVDGNNLTLQYVLSTWNPYVVVRMKSTVAINR
jgi:hypothetical protein